MTTTRRQHPQTALNTKGSNGACALALVCAGLIWPSLCASEQSEASDASAEPETARLTIEVRGLDLRQGLAAVITLVEQNNARLVNDESPFKIGSPAGFCDVVTQRYSFDNCIAGGLPEALAQYNKVDATRLKLGQEVQVPRVERFFYRSAYPIQTVEEPYRTGLKDIRTGSKQDAPVPLTIRETDSGEIVQGAFQGLRVQTEPLDLDLAKSLYSTLSSYPYGGNRNPARGTPDLRVLIDVASPRRTRPPLFGGSTHSSHRRPSIHEPVAGMESSYLHILDWIPENYQPPACVSSGICPKALKLVFTVEEPYRTGLTDIGTPSKQDAPVPLTIQETDSGKIIQGAFQGLRVQTQPLDLDLDLAKSLYNTLSSYPYGGNRDPARGTPDLRVLIDVASPRRTRPPLFGGSTHSSHRRPSIHEPVAGMESSYLHILDWIPANYQPPACVSSGISPKALKLVFIDRPLARNGHPDLFPIDHGSSVCMPGSDNTGTLLDFLEFEKTRDHGMHMVGIVEACNNGGGLKGIAPGSPYELVPWEDDRDSNYIYNVRQQRTFVSYFPIFVFASRFPSELQKLKDITESVGSYSTPFSDPPDRYKQPALKDMENNTAILWITAAGQRTEASPLSPELTQTSHLAPMNIGDNPAVIVVTACDPCSKEDANIPVRAFRSGLIVPENDAGAIPLMVNVAAPGMSMWGLAGSQNAYSEAGEPPNTSHATAFVAGVVRGMLACYWDKYSADMVNINGDLKQRLMVTSWPGHLKTTDIKGKYVTVGIADPEAAWLDPSLTWIRTKDTENHCFRPAGAVLKDDTCANIGELSINDMRDRYSRFDVDTWCRQVIPFSNGNPRNTVNLLRFAVWPKTSRYFTVSLTYPDKKNAQSKQWLNVRSGPLDTALVKSAPELLRIRGESDGEVRTKILKIEEVGDVILNGIKPHGACL